MELSQERVANLSRVLDEQDPRLLVLDRIAQLDCQGTLANKLWKRLYTLPSVYTKSTWPEEELLVLGVNRPVLAPIKKYGTFS